jgi:hypothetical protein
VKPARRDARDRKSKRASASGVETPPKVGFSKTELLVWVGLLVLAAAAVVWVHASRFFFQWTDEQIHLYVARRISEGAVLYRDIESARPPLVLFPAAVLIKLGFSPLLAGRALVVSSQLAIAGVLFWGGWRLASLRAGGAAALLFLVSPEVYTRIPYTGIQLVTLGISACVLLSLQMRPLLAGLACGFALGAGQHGIVICAVAGMWLTVRRWCDGVWFALGTLLVGVVIFGGAWSLGGRNLWESLVGHHLYHLSGKHSGETDISIYFPPWFFEHVPLILCSLAAMALPMARPSQVKDGQTSTSSRWTVGLLLIVIAAHFTVTLSMSGGLFLYLVVVTPLLALLAGLGLDAMFDWFKRQHAMSVARARRALRMTLALGAAALALSAGAWAAAQAHQERLDTLHYSYWPHRRHAEMARLQKLDVANQVATELATLPKNRSLFGFPTIVSAVALTGGWRVAGELADLAPRWIEQGTVNREEITTRIEQDGVAALVTPPWGFVNTPYFKAYLAACYENPTTIRHRLGQGVPDILVFRHIEKEYPCRVTLPPVKHRDSSLSQSLSAIPRWNHPAAAH